MSISRRLREFADSLVPDEEEIIRSGEIACRIAAQICTQFRRRHIIDRISPDGSCVRKATIVDHLNIDLFVYINDRFPPFDDILDDLSTFLQSTFSYECKVARHRPSIVVVEPGVDISFVIARNFLPERLTNHDGKRDSVVQNAETIAFLQHNTTKHNFEIPEVSLYGSSLLEAQLEFERSKSSFVSALCRLTVYWFVKCTDLGVESDTVLFRVIELLATRAAEREEKTGNRDMCSALFRFLSIFELPLEVDIFWTTYYDYEDSPYSIRNERPLLLDPCNPFVNLLCGEWIHRLSDLWFVAASTYSRLVNAQKTGTLSVELILRPEAPCNFM